MAVRLGCLDLYGTQQRWMLLVRILWLPLPSLPATLKHEINHTRILNSK